MAFTFISFIMDASHLSRYTCDDFLGDQEGGRKLCFAVYCSASLDNPKIFKRIIFLAAILLRAYSSKGFFFLCVRLSKPPSYLACSRAKTSSSPRQKKRYNQRPAGNASCSSAHHLIVVASATLTQHKNSKARRLRQGSS